MNSDDIRKIFEKSDEEIVIDSGKREEALRGLHQEISRMKSSDVSAAAMYDRKRIFMRQFCYMDKTMLWLQMGGCVIMLFAAAAMSRLKLESEDMLVFVAILSTLLSVFSLTGIGRIFAANMTELSESCYFNVKQMVALQLMSSDVLNLTALLLVVIFTGFRWPLTMVQAALYILVPYVMTQCGCMGVLLTEFGRQNTYIMFAAGILLCMCYIFIGSVPGIYQASAIMFWGIAFMAGMMILGTLLRILFAGIEKGEMLCMN